MQMKTPIPILRSFDETKTKEFYLDFLGFTILFEHRFEPSAPLYMGIQNGSCILHISEHFGDGCPGVIVRVEVEDVDALCKELNEKRYRHSRPGVMEQSWGFREMTISDPSNNRLVFCTPLTQ